MFRVAAVPTMPARVKDLPQARPGRLALWAREPSSGVMVFGHDHSRTIADIAVLVEPRSITPDIRPSHYPSENVGTSGKNQRRMSVANEEISMFQKVWSLGNYHKLAVEHQIISERLVVEAGIRAGQKVLDLAAGTGNTALAAARRRARVTATDVVPEMLDVARQRIEAEQLDGVEYHVGNSSPTIPFPDGAFDAVLSSLGASFFPDHQRVVDELLRITRPGGTIAIALWPEAGLPSDVFRAGQDLSLDATELDKIQPAYRLGNGAYLAERLKGRASAVRIVSETYESCFITYEDFAEAHLRNHPPAILRMAAYTPEQREHYKQTLLQIAKNYNRATDGTIAICMDYLIVIINKV